MRSPCYLSFLTLTASTALVACSASRPSVEGMAPRIADEGIVLSESYMVPGTTHAATAGKGQSDCEGPGLGIIVGGSLSGGKYLYDANGEPCVSAEVMFDGSTPIGTRQADPTIALSMHDDLGPIPPEDAPKLPEVRVSSQLLATSSTVAEKELAAATTLAAATPIEALPPRPKKQPEAPKQPDPLVTQLASWQAEDQALATRSAESDAAATRNLENIAREAQAKKEQETIAQLSSRLRERERQIQEEQRRMAETLENAAQHRQQTVAAKESWSKREADLQTELSTTQTRLQQFEALAQQLKLEKARNEKDYQSKISRLSGDLKAAERQAEASRRELIAQAAAKIAEAEQLSNAAKLQEQEVKLREAERLKAEAATMMDRALALRAGQSVQDVMNGGPSPAAGEDISLMDTQVVVHEKNQPLDAILANVLKQLKRPEGAWSSDWQLSGKAQYVLKEKWSLTAEAPLQQVLEQLANQVKAAHGMVLSFTPFEKSRILVVTDTPGAKPPAQ